MSTVAPPPHPPAPPVHAALVDSEGFIDDHIRRTRRSLKLVDLASSAITLAVGLLAFLLAAGVIDHWIVPGGLGTAGRLAMFGLLLAGIAWYAWRSFGPLARSINPVYAAHTIEKTSPTLKNSLLNVLLFRNHRQGMSAKVYHALEQQAAQRLSATSADAAIDHSALLRLGYALVAVIAACVIYAVLSPKNLATSAGRVLAPWADLAAPSRVTIVDVQPGNASVALGERVHVSADILAIRESDSVRLHYTTDDESLVDETIVMTRPASAGKFSADLPRGGDVSRAAGAGSEALGVQQGLEYWIEAGDAVSRRFKLTVFERPTIVVQRVHYNFPAYTGEPTLTVNNVGDVRGIEGTEVLIEALANQDIKSAYVDFDSDGRSDVRMDVDGRNAKARFKLQLRDDRRTPWHLNYSLRFTTTADRTNEDPAQYNIEVTPDYTPEVRITQPEEADLPVRVDETVLIGVEARDPDFALSQVNLVGRVGDRDVSLGELLAREHRKLYKHLHPFVPGDAQLKPGDVLEYWAEARDNRSPEGNLAVSEHRRLRIVDPNAQGGQQQQQPGGGGGAQNNDAQGGGQDQQGAQGGQQGEGQQGGEGAQGEGQQGEGQQGGGGQQGGEGEQQGEGQEGGQNAQGGAAGQGGQQQDGQQQGEGAAGGESGAGSESQENAQGQGQGGGQQGDQNQQGDQQGDAQANAGNAGGDNSGDGEAASAAGSEGENQNGANGAQENTQGGSQDGSAGQQQAGRSQGRGQQGGQPERVSSAGEEDAEAFNRISDKLGQQDAAGSAEGNQQQPGGEGQAGGEQQNNAGNQDAANADAGNQGGQQGGNADSAQRQQPAGEAQGGAQQNPGESGPNPDGNPTNGADTPRDGTDPNNAATPEGEGETPAGADNSANQNNGAAPGGDEAAGQPGAPEASNKAPRDKPNGDEESQSGAESETPSADSRGKTESDARGDQSGDRAGDGRQGGGQQAENAGQGEAGSHEPSDTGQGQSQDPGAGETGSQAGNEQLADGQTGQSSGDQRGNGSQTGNAGDEQSTGGEQGENSNEGEAASAAGREGEGADQPPAGANGNQQQPGGEQNGGEPNGGEQGAQQGGQQPGGQQGDQSGQQQGGADQSGQQQGGGQQGENGGESGEQPAGGEQPGEQAGGQNQTGGQPNNGARDQGAQQPGGEQQGQQPDNRDANAGDDQPPNDSASQGSTGRGGSPANPQSGGTQGGGVDGDGVMREPGGDEANLEYAKKQTDLVLDRLSDQLAKKQVDPELLKSLGWTEDELRRFVDRWKGLRAAAEAEGEHPGDASARLEAALRALGPRWRGPRNVRGVATEDKLRDINDSYRARAPLEYADRVRAYMKGAASDSE